MNIYIIFVILVLFAVLGFTAILSFKKKGRPTDYKTIFIMGILWFVLGVPLENPGLYIMGVVFMVVGMFHKDKWKQNSRPWSKLSKKDKDLKMKMVLALGVLVLLTFLTLILKKAGAV
jgi:hypothetical protein